MLPDLYDLIVLLNTDVFVVTGVTEDTALHIIKVSAY
jgi:hypothetical protein